MQDAVSCHDTFVVPANERRHPVTMGLVWITMVTGMPAILVGFNWYKSGIDLWQVALSTVISCVVLLIYSIPAVQLGARSGQTYSMLSRSVFGRYGYYLVTVNMIAMFILFYGFTSLFIAEGLKGLYPACACTAGLAFAIALICSFNNLFGFAGVANFARFFAAPVLIFWIGFSFLKAAGACHSFHTVSAHVPVGTALTTVSSFVIGYAIWGNEPDYWRYSKPRKLHSGIAIAVALLLGQALFPATGWMLAQLTGVTDSQAAIKVLNDFSLGGAPLLAALVLVATSFACEDSNMFGMVAALRGLKQMNHRAAVLLLALAGGCVAVALSATGSANAIEAIASLNCIIMPTPTVIMLVEWFLQTRVFAVSPFVERVATLDSVPTLRIPATVALIFGCAVGVLTSGVIPGTEHYRFGVACVQGWLAAILLYVPLRMREFRRQTVFAPQYVIIKEDEPELVASAR